MRSINVYTLLVLLPFFVTRHTPSQQITNGSVKQAAHCAVQGVQGNVTLICPGVPRSIVALLKKQFEARLREQDIHVEQLTTEINDWKDRYDKLLQLFTQGPSSENSRKADQLIRDGKWDEAGKVLDHVLEENEEETDRLAKTHFERALILELQSEPLKSLPHYEQAYVLRPANVEYAEGYGFVLYQENEYLKALPILEQTIRIYRDLVSKDQSEYLIKLASTLNTLGLLYREVGELDRAENVFSESAVLSRRLAETNPGFAEYMQITALENLGVLYRVLHRWDASESVLNQALSYEQKLTDRASLGNLDMKAAIFNSLAVLYRLTNRLAESEKAYLESLAAYRALSKASARYSRAGEARVLNNLGNLYGDLGSFEQARLAFSQSLDIRRQEAAINPQTYLPELATTLSNEANLYRFTGDLEKSKSDFEEAIATQRKLVATYRQAYLPDLARSLSSEALLYSSLHSASEAESNVMESLSAYRELAKDNPQAYTSEVFRVLGQLGTMYNSAPSGEWPLRVCKEASITVEAFPVDESFSLAQTIGLHCSSHPIAN